MSDEEKPQGEEIKVEEKPQSQDQVVLSPEQYTALLDRIEEAEGKSSRRVLSIDELAEEGRPKGRSREDQIDSVKPNKDIDEMTNRELVDYVFKVADASVTPALQSLETKIETIKVLREIDKLEKTPGYEDFWDYKDQIYKIASDNPTLSLKDAYHLATGKAKLKEAPKEEKRSTLLTLPPRPVLGERPGPSAKVTTETGVGKTIRVAAEKAWKEIMGEKSKVE